MVALTIGMPTYNDFDGVYFTVQALHLYEDLEDTELLVVDNYGCEHTRTFVEGINGRYVLATDAVGTAAAKNRVFAEARGEAVLCCDSHVLFAPGTIARLKSYYRDRPDCRDLLQGPIVYDDLQTISTNFDPVWRGQMWGIWTTDPRGVDPEGEPFEIWGQGMGVFSCRKNAWLGFNPAFRGFGGEEGYIHEKFRKAGARCLCLPWLRWSHRFGRPSGVPYSLTVLDKCRNYIIGLTELGLDLEPVRSHFSEWVSDEQFDALEAEALTHGMSPPPQVVVSDVPSSVGPIALDIHEREMFKERIGILTPSHNRPDLIRMLAMQMALQEKMPDVLCIHQNGDPESYEWAIADLSLPFKVIWIHSPEIIPQDEWYSRPLRVLLDEHCTHFFWCDDDDIYRSNHLARSMMMLTDPDDPCDFVVNGYSGMLYKKKGGYEYRPCVRFRVHDPGGMSSSMAFNRAFAEELFQDLVLNQRQLPMADQVVRRVTMPKFRCKLDERETPSTIYVCHPGADSSSHWLGEG